jgi:hypothetical protein
MICRERFVSDAALTPITLDVLPALVTSRFLSSAATVRSLFFSPIPALQTSGPISDLPLCVLALFISAATLDLAPSITTLDFLVSITELLGRADAAFLPWFHSAFKARAKVEPEGLPERTGRPVCSRQ